MSSPLLGLLGSPLRVLLVQELLAADTRWSSSDTLGIRLAALERDLEGVAAPLVRGGWLEERRPPGVVQWRAARGRRRALSQAATLAESRLGPIVQRLRDAGGGPFSHVVGDGPRMKLVFEQARVAARAEVPVLITGETGTGKELVARGIHRLGARCDKPFVAINLASVPKNLIEAELFGYCAGAFTGATHDSSGRVVEAHGGSLFLDEIAELPATEQASLLQLLETRRVQPLGSEHSVEVDFQLICATNRALEPLIERGEFREDLFYRINLFRIHLPSLRERPEDVPALARRFALLATDRHGVPAAQGIDDDALSALARQPWPGNVRELENAVYRAALAAGGGNVTTRHVEQALRPLRYGAAQPPDVLTETSDPTVIRPIAEVIRGVVTDSLRRQRGNVEAAARDLGISKVTLYRHIRRLEGEEPGLLEACRSPS